MRKAFCDFCGQQVKEGDSARKLEFEQSGRIRSAVTSGTVYLDGDFDTCRYCIIDSINALDDRQKEQ
jgi:hypothetical protein